MPPEAAHDDSISVLLVEDEPAVASAVRRMLDRSETKQFTVSVATQVEEALGRIQLLDFDIMLLDLSLPDGVGLQTMLRAKVAAATLPIVVMTTKATESQALAAVRAGAQDYLVKGQWSSELLVRTVLHAIERHRVFDELRKTKREQHYLATHDRLTGLPNRGAFQDALARAISSALRRGTRLAVLFLDLDRFKLINDTLGHPVGDQLLKEVGERIGKLSRKSDIAARLGGDEFILLAQETEKETSSAVVAERVLDELRRPFLLDDTEHWITSSVGIAVYPEDGTDVDVLIRNADAAMYGAKAAGGDQYMFFSESANQRISKRLALENSLRGALSRDEFTLHYQPIFEAVSRSPGGAEALIRWQDPEGELVAPGTFIPIAEETGLILSIGEWVLRNACAQWAQWHAQGAGDSRVSVNLSSLQVRGSEIVRLIREILEESKLSPALLEVEVTETALASGGESVVDNLAQLRAMGITTALDDFGTGYSSLSRLRQLPFDRLKIDRSFVAETPADPQAAALISAIINMAHSLEMRVVAEGVETAEQAEFLEESGCDQLQGFLLGRPLEPADFALQFLPTGSPRK